jgi:RimJ/RimL family protein N-acetyltransferase
LFLVRTSDEIAWGVRADAPDEVARLAATEPRPRDFRDAPVHAGRYDELLGGAVESGPAFVFPEQLERHADVVRVEEFEPLRRRFRRDELEGRAPIYAIVEDGVAVSFCHSARSSGEAAEAGVFTEPSHRGRGLAPRVTSAWAAAIRTSERVPIYSTSWLNEASLAVARKLGLHPFGCDFSVA